MSKNKNPGHGKSKIMKKLAKKLGKKTKLKYVDVGTMDLGDLPTPRSWCGIPFGVSKSGFILLDDVKTEPVQPRPLDAAHRAAKEREEQAFKDVQICTDALLIDYLWTELDKAREREIEAAEVGDVLRAYPSREAVRAELRQGYNAPMPTPYSKGKKEEGQ